MQWILFHGTIRDNLRWGKSDATEEEMYNALKQSQAMEFVEKKKNQLNSRSVIVIVLCFVLLLYMGIRFVKAQSEINAKEAQLTELESIYESQIAENEELEAAIKDGDKKELAEEYARKKGYVMPDERVYVDITPGSAE